MNIEKEREAYSRAAFYKTDGPAVGQMDGNDAAWWGWRTRAALDEQNVEDAILGRVALRFVDRAGDVHPGIDDAERVCAEFHAAICEAIDEMLEKRKEK